MFNFGRWESPLKKRKDQSVKLIPVHAETAYLPNEKSMRDMGRRDRHSKSTVSLPSIRQPGSDFGILRNNDNTNDVKHEISTLQQL